MPESPTSKRPSLLQWLAAHTRFPASRLPGRAELLLLIGAAAAQEEADAQASQTPIQRRDGAKDAAMRAHALRRSLAHYRCDNGAKV